MCNEPFCWSLADAREITDEWFDRHIWEPAQKRAKKYNRGGDNGPEGGEVEDQKAAGNKMPTREEYVMYGQTLGGNPEELGLAYDRWKQSRQKKKG